MLAYLCAIALIFHTVGRYICEVSQAQSTVTTSHVSGANCYVVTAKNVWITKPVSLVHVTVITLIGLYTLIHLIHSVHNNVGVHSFIC